MKKFIDFKIDEEIIPIGHVNQDIITKAINYVPDDDIDDLAYNGYISGYNQCLKDNEQKTNVFVLCEVNAGTPEANEIYAVYTSEDKAKKAALNALVSNYGFSEKKATKVMDNYYYISKYKIE